MIERIKIACSTENLKEVRSFVTSTLSKFNLSDTEINMMVLAVDEICANRIIHSNKSNKNKFLELEISEKEDGVSFNITDSGDFYDASANYTEPDINELIQQKRKGGIGLMLVRRIMDSIEVKKDNTSITHVLFKRLKISES